MRAADLLDRSPGAWRAATQHSFLDAVRHASIAPGAFTTWLAQDHRFVADLLGFQARLLARAPRPAQAPLAGGLVALIDELAWFEGHAGRLGLDLGAAPLPATARYAALLDELDALPYEQGVVALWALERVYLEAWAYAGPADGAYAEFVEHWTAPGFDAYVAALEGLADEALRDADAGKAEALFVRVLEHETAFWDAATGDGA